MEFALRLRSTRCRQRDCLRDDIETASRQNLADETYHQEEKDEDQEDSLLGPHLG